jgi:hypothetical protein
MILSIKIRKTHSSKFLDTSNDSKIFVCECYVCVSIKERERKESSRF